MIKASLWGIVALIFCFLFLSGFIASKIQVELPYSTNTTSVFDIIWDEFEDWINPFS